MHDKTNWSRKHIKVCECDYSTLYLNGVEKIKMCKTLIRPVAKYWAESWTLNVDIARRLVAFEGNVLRILWGIKLYENWRKRYNKESVQLFGDLDILSFVRINLLNWIGHVNRIDRKRIVSQVFNNIPQGSRLGSRRKTRWWNYVI